MTRGLRTTITVGVPVVVVGLLVVAALVASRRDPATYAEGSPEATVQAYFRTVIDRDAGGAYQLFSPELQDRCGRPTSADIGYQSVSRVVLGEVTTKGDAATVRVTVSESTGDLLVTDEVSRPETLHLERVNGRWLIDELPWPYFNCVAKG